jgi:hypothetical protein
MIRRVERHPHALGMRSGHKPAPGIADQTIAIERPERHISTRQRATNELRVHAELRIAGSRQEFLRMDDPDGDTVRKMRSRL